MPIYEYACPEGHDRFEKLSELPNLRQVLTACRFNVLCSRRCGGWSWGRFSLDGRKWSLLLVQWRLLLSAPQI
jgi:hypothetical protein